MNYADDIYSIGFSIHVYANDHQPIHVHVIEGGARAKYEIMPIRLVKNQGFKVSELKIIETIIEENQEIIAQHWNRFF